MLHMNEALIILVLTIYLMLQYVVFDMLILGLIDNHLKMIETPKSNWLTNEEY